jgi:molybdate transport system substrate-binding protein
MAKRSIVAMALLVVGASSLHLQAADLRVMSGGGAQTALRTLAPDFQNATGNKVQLEFAVVGVIQQKLARGEKADVAVLPVALLDAMEKAGVFGTKFRTIVGRIPIGVVVREGVDGPDIAHPDAVRKALMDARSVTLPDPNATPTGKHLMGAFAQMGIAGSMLPKITFKNAIDGGVDLVRDGRVDLGLFLVTEILPVKGVRLVGTLPASLQGYVVYAAAVAADSNASEAALQFVKFLSNADARTKWKAAGFESTDGI